MDRFISGHAHICSDFEEVIISCNPGYMENIRDTAIAVGGLASLISQIYLNFNHSNVVPRSGCIMYIPTTATSSYT
jgi:hypothetical protein